MAGIASKNVNRSSVHTTADVTLDDGRTGRGEKHSGFLGLQDSTKEDEHIATTRAVKNANAKEKPKD